MTLRYPALARVRRAYVCPVCSGNPNVPCVYCGGVGTVSSPHVPEERAADHADVNPVERDRTTVAMRARIARLHATNGALSDLPIPARSARNGAQGGAA